jgi:hypothetical protein
VRCLACNKVLNDFEATRKSATTGEYVDLCNHCFHDVEYDIESLEREDLRNNEDVDDSPEYNDLQGDLFDGIKE